jgi:hypothetical protein
VRAGVAKQEFQLPAKVPLAGYSHRRGKTAQGVHDPVGVRALVITDGSTAVALVSCDLLIVDERLSRAVQARLLADEATRSVALMLAATHTHSGPGGYGQKFLEKLSMGHFDPAVFEAIVAQVAQTVEQATVRLEPVRLAYHRREVPGLVVNRIASDGLVDPELIVCAFYGSRREPLAILVSFSAHPTTLGAWNMELSADYPGVLVRAVESRWPSATCLFFAGAVGDQAPVKRGEGFAAAQWLGEQLAERVIGLLDDEARPAEVTDVGALQEEVCLPAATLRLGGVSLPRWLSRRFVDDDATVSVARIGEVIVQGVPCDLTASMGRQLKDAAGRHHWKPLVIGFANDYIGYCIPESLYGSDAYEASLAFNGPHAGTLIVERSIQLLEQL